MTSRLKRATRKRDPRPKASTIKATSITATNSTPAIEVAGLSHWYGKRQALRDLSFAAGAGEIFALLGPNGGGKTTLFRLLSTLIPLQQGSARIFDADVQSQLLRVRSSIGVVFQAPSLDKKLTVRENIRHQAAMYGLSGGELRQREQQMLEQLGLTDRAAELVEKLSGGLRRRVELAKGMIHRPRLLLLDEPSTGLDPGARIDLWRYLHDLRDHSSVTIAFTTHLLEEAERADRIAILDQGSLVALDSPDALRATVGGDSITIKTIENPTLLADKITHQFDLSPRIVDGQVRLEIPRGQDWIPKLINAFPRAISSITWGRPSLEDVFIARTGHRFWSQNGGEQA